MYIAISLILLSGVILLYSRKYNEIENKNIKLEEDYRKLLHQKKSSEVRLGKVAEHLSPFLESWPWDPNNFRFLATPVDGIQFTDDEVIFLEIKTGGSKLSKKQKEIRNLVNDGKVTFKTFTVNDKGCHIK